MVRVILTDKIQNQKKPLGQIQKHRTALKAFLLFHILLMHLFPLSIISIGPMLAHEMLILHTLGSWSCLGIDEFRHEIHPGNLLQHNGIVHCLSRVLPPCKGPWFLQSTAGM